MNSQRDSSASLSDPERDVLSRAGATPSPTVRRQSVAIVLAKTGSAQAEAKEVLTASYIASMQPSFHLIPRGDAMADEGAFARAYRELAAQTDSFTNVDRQALVAALTASPDTLAPLRMILGFTFNELAQAMRLTRPGTRTRGDTLKRFERSTPQEKPPVRRIEMIDTIAETVLAIMERSILQVPESVQAFFHSKLDKRDTVGGWPTVAADADGVPYSALLYQRYVGGVWRQVQDAYSEVKGDKVLENPIANLFDDNGIPYYRSAFGASGAARTARRFGLSPGPDFLLPDDSPTVAVESKVGEDGGTVRDKAARIRSMADAVKARGLLACVVVDGRGWSERPNALADVVIATEGRTYSLATLQQLLEIPEISALRADDAS